MVHSRGVVMSAGALAVLGEIAVLMDVKTMKSWTEVHQLTSNPLKFLFDIGI